jgi:hypothetical protein
MAYNPASMLALGLGMTPMILIISSIILAVASTNSRPSAVRLHLERDLR